jgi:hypothetical protein
MTKQEHAPVLLEQVVALFKNGKSWNSVPNIVTGPGPHSYLLMHFLQMRAAGWKGIDLDEMTALSGAGALYGYEHGDHGPKYAFRNVKPDSRIAAVTGFGYEWVSFKGADAGWTVLRESIDSGRPVKGEHVENVLFAGYQNADKTEDRKVFAMSDEPGTFARWWTWGEFESWVRKVSEGKLGRHTERLAAADAGTSARRVVKELVEWSTEPPAEARNAFPNALFGLAGLEAYAKDCADLVKYPEFSMCHDMNCQWATRKCTAIYLKRVAERRLLPHKATALVASASESYWSAYKSWAEVFRQIGWDAPKGAGKDKGHRQAASQALQAALNHEKAGIAALKKAIALLEQADAEPAPGHVR